MIERLVDRLAQQLKMDPAEIRRRNFIPPFDNGHPVATGLTYDSGNYHAAMAKLLEKSGYDDYRA
jgi:carbon-monoxide dehydrogenase large subunit